MIEYFKDDLGTTGTKSQLDDFTRYEFSFSGLLCHVLGTFYRDSTGKLHFGADVENFYSPHHYNVYKPTGKVLELIANYHDETYIMGGLDTVKIGRVRYSDERQALFPFDDNYYSRFCEAYLFEPQKLIFDCTAKKRPRHLT